MSASFNKIQYYSQWNCTVLFRTLWLISADIPVRMSMCRNFGVPPSCSQLWVIMSCPCYRRAFRSAVNRIKKPGSKPWTSEPLCLNLHCMINDPLLFVTGCRWCLSSAKITKRVTIEKSKLPFVTPKIIPVIPYSYNYLVSYPISLKLFCQLFLVPKTPYRASLIRSMYRPMPVINVCFTFKNKKERET